MKLSSLSLITTTIIFFIGCGGGSGSVVPPPTPPPVVNTPFIPTTTPEQRVDTYWETTEYYASSGLDTIKASGAYKYGYSGNGVTLAVIDSGVDYSHRDLDSKIVNSISFIAYTYNPTTQTFSYTPGGINQTQIETIELSNYGSGYTQAPTVTITGDGTGATAMALLDATGHIEGIYMTSHGTGYSEATITIDETGTGGSGAVVSNIRFGGEDDYGHGSGIAGIMVGEKNDANSSVSFTGTMQGVAYGANIISARVLSDNLGTMSNVYKGIDWAVANHADVINLSLGTTTGSTNFNIPTFSNALSQNATFVISSGNDGKSCLPVAGSLENQCSFPAALPSIVGNEGLLQGNGGWIVVGSVDSNLSMSSFSNKAGVTKEYYLVAPGRSITTTYRDNMYTTTNGTSFAAPFVSGAVALLYEKFPYLTGNQLSQILFETATDLGAVGVDDIYGHGLIDLEKAFSPIGELVIPTGTTINGTTSAVQNTTIRVSSLLSEVLIHSQAFGSMIALDKYDRTFIIPTTSTIYPQTSSFSFSDFTYKQKEGNFILGFDNINQRMMVGYEYNKKYTFMFSFTNDLFGSEGEGELDLGSTRTYYAAYNSYYQFEDTPFVLSYELSYGLGDVDTSESSLIKHMSNLHAVGGKLELFYKEFGLKYELPLAIVKGDATFHIPVGRDMIGNIIYQDFNENLKTHNREQRLSAIYFSSFMKGFNYHLETTKIFNQNHQDKDGYEFMFKFNYVW